MPHYVAYTKSVSPPMSPEKLREIFKRIDTNGDGHISKKELEEALRGVGLWLRGWRARRAIAHADIDRNGFINGDEELMQLLNHAQKQWGITIS